MCAPHTHTMTGTDGLMHIFSARHHRHPLSPSTTRLAQAHALSHLQTDLWRQPHAGIWHLDSTAHTHRLHPASRTYTDVFAHPDTGRHGTRVEKQHVLSRPCTRRHTGSRPGPQRTLFPGPCCHTVEMQHPPRAPSRPTPPGPASHVDEKTKIWLGRERWAARRGRGRR